MATLIGDRWPVGDAAHGGDDPVSGKGIGLDLGRRPNVPG
jgi:hypothetical protein